MTTFYADVSEFNQGVSLKGTPFVAARATEGDWLADPDYEGYKHQAASLGIPLMAYHFLEGSSSAKAQASFCHGIVGTVPLMLDFEPIIDSNGVYVSKPSLDLAAAFVDAYRVLGGICWLAYLPQWYWGVLGSPSLEPFASRGLHLVSSDYVAYSDNGPGWQPYGGMTPAIWQYTDAQDLNGVATDFNAYRGTVADLVSLVTTGHLPSPRAQEEPMFVVPVPAAPGEPFGLALPDGLSHLRFCSHAGASLRVDFFGIKPTEAVSLSYGQAPHVDLDGAKAVQVYRDDTGSNVVTVAGY